MSWTLLLLACASPPVVDSGADTAPLDSGDAPPPTDVLFRFVVIADPHVSAATGDALDRLDRAVAWIEAEKDTRGLGLVLIVGDIAWADGFEAARGSLERLTIPWVPINGDNEVQLDWEEDYALAFADHYTDLASTLADWEMGPVEVENPEWGTTSWFHNVAFTHQGVRFIGLDWASRHMSSLHGEFGEFHDFEGGTWPFFEAQVTAASSGPIENVILFSHIPMHLPMFDLAEMEQLVALTAPLGEHVWANLAGHYHASASETVPDAGFDLHVTDATWDDDIELRIVEVRADETRFAPVTELVTLP